ncbi:hypothetical protein B0H11DRAFT_467482 [Mycena galericulata]|nr:hypothetical protein B0H11DRAFT_467482 [Mycena galericulata]
MCAAIRKGCTVARCTVRASPRLRQPARRFAAGEHGHQERDDSSKGTIPRSILVDLDAHDDSEPAAGGAAQYGREVEQERAGGVRELMPRRSPAHLPRGTENVERKCSTAGSQRRRARRQGSQAKYKYEQEITGGVREPIIAMIHPRTRCTPSPTSASAAIRRQGWYQQLLALQSGISLYLHPHPHSKLRPPSRRQPDRGVKCFPKAGAVHHVPSRS